VGVFVARFCIVCFFGKVLCSFPTFSPFFSFLLFFYSSFFFPCLPQVTTYVRAGVLALVVLASFAETPCAVVLDYDWTALGFPASQARLQAPALPAFQPTAVPDMPLDGPIAVPVGQGWMLLLTNINHQQ
jgi:hypothetical protein